MAFLRRRRPNPTTLLAVPSTECRAHHAISEELNKIRPWFKAQVCRWEGGKPFVWMQTSPITGLMLMHISADWYAQPMGLDKDNEPMRIGLDPRPVSPGLSTRMIARELVTTDVLHAMSTYVAMPGYDTRWASEELLSLGMDGYAE